MSSNIASALREQYGRRSLRPIKGDTIKVLRGEYSGIEGKIEKVNTKSGTLSIEGVQREKIRGGNVKVPIHASNVQVVSLKLDDKLRLKLVEEKPKEASRRLTKEIPEKSRKVEVDEPIKLKEASKLSSNKKIKKRNLDKRRKA